MSSPVKPWESAAMSTSNNTLQNSSQIFRNMGPSRVLNGPQVLAANTPVLPPRPSSMQPMSVSPYNSYMPFSNGYGSRYSSYGGYGGAMSPYRSMGMYGSYNGYNNYDGYACDDTERRFIQYAEESSRNTFASVESLVRAFNSLAMMLDNTFFAMTSSFRAILSVAENFGRLRSMFGHLWYTINIFRFFSWLLRKLKQRMGLKVPHTSTSSLAWKEAAGVAAPPSSGGGSNWPTFAFLGVIVSAPYLISKFLPKFEDKSDPSTWQSPGVRAKVAYDFVASMSNELSVRSNEMVTLAPAYVQEEMQLKNSGWAFAVAASGKSGLVPLNYLVFTRPQKTDPVKPAPKTHTKRVSFGENQVFEHEDTYKHQEAPEQPTKT